MFKMFVVAIFGIFLYSSDIALSADMKTAEKWVCSREDVTRILRLYAPEKGLAPCKVFYYKRVDSDPTDALQEAEQNAGEKKPIYYSTGNGEFCVRKMNAFKEEKIDQSFSCVKI